jgi:5'-3' exonuclease
MFSLDKNRDWLEFFNKFKDRFEIVEINNKNSLLIKLIMGDKSDNISSIYQTLTKTGKLQGIGESGAEKICEFYNTHFDNNINTDDDTFKNNIIECIE